MRKEAIATLIIDIEHGHERCHLAIRNPPQNFMSFKWLWEALPIGVQQEMTLHGPDPDSFCDIILDIYRKVRVGDPANPVRVSLISADDGRKYLQAYNEATGGRLLYPVLQPDFRLCVIRGGVAHLTPVYLPVREFATGYAWGALPRDLQEYLRFRGVTPEEFQDEIDRWYYHEAEWALKQIGMMPTYTLDLSAIEARLMHDAGMPLALPMPKDVLIKEFSMSA